MSDTYDSPTEPQGMPDDLNAAADGCPPVDCAPNLSFATDIVVMFTENDISCMQGEGIDLSNYEVVKAHAPRILGAVCTGFMPLGGPKWSSEMTNTFSCWIEQGCQP